MRTTDGKNAARLTELRKLTADELAENREAARIVARLTRDGAGATEQAKPVRVAAFNSYI